MLQPFTFDRIQTELPVFSILQILVIHLRKILMKEDIVGAKNCANFMAWQHLSKNSILSGANVICTGCTEPDFPISN